MAEIIIDGYGTGSALRINPDGTIGISGVVAVDTYPGSLIFQGTDPWIILGSTHITNSSVPISGGVSVVGSVSSYPTTNFAADSVTTNIFRMGMGVWNGTGFDRARALSGTNFGFGVLQVVEKELPPTDSIINNPAWSFSWLGFSGTSIGIGSVIGSIVQFIGAGSYVQKLTYDLNYNITSIGSWS